MFNNNVTQTYNFQDASQEIIIMLLGAFLLGCLLTWLLNKLFGKDYSAENNSYRYDTQNKQIESLSPIPVKPADTTSDVRIVKKPTNQVTKAVPSADDLTKLSGINKETLFELKKHGISSFTSLRDIKTRDLKSIQENSQTQKRIIETWPHQASLAAKGDWSKLKDYQDFIQRAQNASNKTAKAIPNDADDLKVVEGINSEIEGILNNKEIFTLKKLSQIDSDVLRNYIVDANPQLQDIDTETWSHQAAMAEKGQWDELKIYQGFMDSDSDAPTGILTKKIETDFNSSTKEIDANANQENLSDHDDLKKIEGIGPKIEEILNQGGIYTFSQLYNSDRNRLRKLLDDAGNQFKMHDPNSWPHQAGMANRSEWNDLKSYQRMISKDQKDNSELKAKKTNDSIKETTVTNSSQKDDLKKIEGIGPKIEELLNNAGIHSFVELSTNTRDSIKKLLNEAGPQFRMHEPESWSHQAKLAAKGDWIELEKYQEFLLGGYD